MCVCVCVCVCVYACTCVCVCGCHNTDINDRYKICIVIFYILDNVMYIILCIEY